MNIPARDPFLRLLPVRHAGLLFSLAAAGTSTHPICAQEPPAGEARPVGATSQPAQPTQPRSSTAPSKQAPSKQAPERPYIRLQWPQDDATVVAQLGDEGITLGEVIRHHEANHWPGLGAFLKSTPGDLYFDSPWPARWVRWYADVRVLREEAIRRKLDPDTAKPFVEEALRGDFQEFLQSYAQQLVAKGRDQELTQKRVDLLLDGFQREQGLLAERSGWLQFLEPGESSEADLYEFYRLNPWFFGGRVKARHILFGTRDPQTGILLKEAPLAVALTRLQDAEKQLKTDPGAFEDLARKMSEDLTTGRKGGELPPLPRFQERLPMELSRAAWLLEDGQVSGRVNTPFGTHLILREERVQRTFRIYHPKLHPQIEAARRSYLQESLLFRLRAERLTHLRY